MRRLIMTRISLGALFVVAGNVGCGNANRIESFPVSGRVVVNGKPASYAKLTFYPTNVDSNEYLLATTAAEDGRFELNARTPPNGNDAVKYDVAVSWRIPQNPLSTNDPEYGKELLPAKYRDPKKSGLQVEVTADTSELQDIEINP